MRQYHSTFCSAAQFPRLAALATNSHEELKMFVHAEFLIPTPPTDDTLFFPRSKVTKKASSVAAHTLDTALARPGDLAP